MTPEAILIKELYDALNWIVFHLDYRPSWRGRVDLVTECERHSLRRMLEYSATDLVKPRGDTTVLATGFEVALIGRLPRDPISNEVESCIYAMRAQIEKQAARIKELEATDRSDIAGAAHEHPERDEFCGRMILTPSKRASKLFDAISGSTASKRALRRQRS